MKEIKLRFTENKKRRTLSADMAFVTEPSGKRARLQGPLEFDLLNEGGPAILNILPPHRKRQSKLRDLRWRFVFTFLLGTWTATAFFKLF